MRLALFIILLCLLTPQPTHADGILDCLEDSPNELHPYHKLQGTNIWLGYAHGGFDLPMDTRGATMTKRWADNDWLVQVWHFPSAPNFTYWFIYDNAEPYTIIDEWGVEHWGIHPCGAFLITKNIWSGE